MTTDNTKSDKAKRTFDFIKANITQNKRFDGHTNRKKKLEALNFPVKSLVFDDVAKKHAKMMEKRVLAMILKNKTNSDALRFVTLLDSVVEMDVNSVLDTVQAVRNRFDDIKKQLPDIHVIGAFEFEIVNFDFNNRHANEIGREKLDESTRNKITVLEALGARKTVNTDFGDLAIAVKATGSKLLLHIHAIVDFGEDTENNITRFETLIASNYCWNISKIQLHIMKLYQTKTLNNNIQKLCSYMTKCGNENLKYKVFYGRDRVNKTNEIEPDAKLMTAHELDAAIYKYAFDANEMTKYEIRKLRSVMYDEIAYENERHLTHGEINFANEVTYAVMVSCRKSTKEGYLLLV